MTKRLLLLPLFAAVVQAQTPLSRGWFIQASTDVSEKGDVLSKAGSQPRGWYRATVPTTVMAALVADRVFPDPDFGMNLRAVPGTSYAIGTNFSGIPMPPGSPFRSSWWYRTEFTPPADYQGKRVQLHFDGINFRANVWLNGKLIADSKTVAGAWRLYEFDVTGNLTPGAPNALAVEVFPPTPEDLAITFVDWNPAPPDKGMGLWRDVYLTASGPVTLRFPQVITKLDLPSLANAHLTVTAEAHNSTNAPVSGTLKGNIQQIAFAQPVTLAANETKVVTFTPAQFNILNVANPKLWWPIHAGEQNLYPLTLTFDVNGAVSDKSETQFGIREVSSQLDPTPQKVRYADGAPAERQRLLFKINGKNILIRGGGYTFDMMLRTSAQKQEDELKYVRDMNLNTVRFEGKMENDHFYDLADKYGILILAGWCCCDHWEQWRNWDDEDRTVAAASLRDQIRRQRNHPSVFAWLNGSDNPPPADIEKMYIDIEKELNWPNPYRSSATAKPTTVTGESGVKMTGPYEYVAPSYWLDDHERGGAHGFNTETSPGPAVPPIEGLRQMLPAEHLWPIDSFWDYHAGGGVFGTINVYAEALNKRYGKATSVEDFASKSQLMAYDGERAMFEAYGRNKYTATGVIQWMLNNAWPSVIWHLYDYYLRPGGGYFGAKKANEPLHIQYSYDDRSIVVVNSFYKDYPNLKASAKVYNLDMTEKYSHDAAVNVPSDGVSKAFVLPQIQGLSGAYFVRLALADASGKTVSTNFYWLPSKSDVLEFDRSTWYYTPTKSFADLTALNTLPRVDLRATTTSETKGDDGVTRVTVENPSHSLAFAVHLKVVRLVREEDTPDSVQEVLPVLWDDNYFSLLPGEKREIAATYHKSSLGRGTPTVEVEGWNVNHQSIGAPAR